MKKEKTSIILRLDPETLEQLDACRLPLNLDRTAWLRRCVARGIEHTKTRELPLLSEEIKAVLGGKQ
jgi:hypothetical protein